MSYFAELLQFVCVAGAVHVRCIAREAAVEKVHACGDCSPE